MFRCKINLNNPYLMTSPDCRLLTSACRLCASSFESISQEAEVDGRSSWSAFEWITRPYPAAAVRYDFHHSDYFCFSGYEVKKCSAAH